MADIYPVRVNGQEMEIEASSPEEAFRKAHTQFQLQQREANSAPTPPPASSPAPDQSDGIWGAARRAAMSMFGGEIGGGEYPADPKAKMREIVGQTAEQTPGVVQKGLQQWGGVVDPVGEYVSANLMKRRPQLDSAAWLARFAPTIISQTPVVGGALQGTGEFVSQTMEQAMGDREGYNPWSIGLAASIPTAARLGGITWGAAKTGVSRLTGGTRRAQEAAQAGGEELVQSLRPAQEAGTYASVAEQHAGELVPTPATSKFIESQARGVRQPVDPGASHVKQTIENIKDRLLPGRVGQPGGQVTLQDIEAVRKDMGGLFRSSPKDVSPDFEHLYGSIVTDLESAGAAGGAGAQAARDMATSFKQTRGADLVERAYKSATTQRDVGGEAVNQLNVGRFGQLIDKQRERLTQLLGDDAMKSIDAFVTKYRGLSPIQAYSMMNSINDAIWATLGKGVAGVPGMVLAPVAREFAKALPGAAAKSGGAVSRGVSGALEAARGAGAYMSED